AAGGTVDGRLGTSFDKVASAVTELTDEGDSGVVVLTDIGSATMTAESVLELVGLDRVVLADAPLVEGAVAGAVAAQGGADPEGVRLAAEAAASTFVAAQHTDGAADPGGQTLERRLELRNSLGLHARPAAMLARLVSGFDAYVEVDGVDGASVLALIGLGLPAGAELTVRARGPQAEAVLAAITQAVEDRFGED